MKHGEVRREEPLRVAVILLSEKGSRDFLEHPPLKFLDEINSVKVTRHIYAFSHLCLRDKGQEGHALRSSIMLSRTFRLQSPHWQLP